MVTDRDVWRVSFNTLSSPSAIFTKKWVMLKTKILYLILQKFSEMGDILRFISEYQSNQRNWMLFGGFCC